MVSYVSTVFAGAQSQPWHNVTDWNVVATPAWTPTSIRLDNADSTYTLLTGTGFALNGSNAPTAGTVTAMQRVDAAGNLIESVTGLSLNLPQAWASPNLFPDNLLQTVFNGNDSMTGSAGTDRFYGGAGNDTMTGLGGFNLYVGGIAGAGDDTFIGAATGAGGAFDQVSYAGATTGIRASIRNSGATAVAVDAANLTIGTDTLVRMDALTGSDHGDAITIARTYTSKFGGFFQVEGGDGNDTITGNGKTALVFFSAAAGILADLGAGLSRSLDGTVLDSAHVGQDGLSGINQVIGTRFADSLSGSNSAAREAFEGGRGNDVINGRGGYDVAQYSRSTAAIVVGLSQSVAGAGTIRDGLGTVDAIAGIEEITGSAFADRFVLGKGRDTVVAGGGNDRIDGRFANDTLYGGDGHDLIIGGLGGDILSGDAGRDIFDFNSRLESQSALGNRDFILDFQHNVDDIDLSTIDARGTQAGNQAFTFIGAKAFSGAAGELNYSKSSGHTFVAGDINGDRAADFLIELNKLINLGKGDFIL
jgi:Ca2+-binding RTX toxin-like protein